MCRYQRERLFPFSLRTGTTILFVLRAGFVLRTILAKFVPFGPPFFGLKLRLPKLRLILDGQTYVRLGRLCSRSVLLGILPCPFLRVTRVLLPTTIRLLVWKFLPPRLWPLLVQTLGRFLQRFPLPGTVLVTHPSRRVRRSPTLVQAPLGQDLDLHRHIQIWPLHTMIGRMAPVLVRGGPIAPSQVVRRFHERTAYTQGADLIALPGTIDRRR